ncbi:uncharacterized protein A4U43_UnF2040 [Asparagus officinalis]|uniref:Phosphofructokinase domain-containing protein n=1 Tax=Asparagus officinalis TaxID=4686 RepID=A0A1R3L7E6_ASPOF|nr:uncharacterized protein A4U43_UnF2040 [Asparagus officinalis]
MSWSEGWLLISPLSAPLFSPPSDQDRLLSPSSFLLQIRLQVDSGARVFTVLPRISPSTPPSKLVVPPISSSLKARRRLLPRRSSSTPSSKLVVPQSSSSLEDRLLLLPRLSSLLQGGFDMICSGRDKIETPEHVLFCYKLYECVPVYICFLCLTAGFYSCQFKQAEVTAKKLDLDGLVIGGDDSNTNACLLSENFMKKNIKTRVIGCPKTIDGDLKCKEVPTSFGFDTACKEVVTENVVFGCGGNVWMRVLS